MNTTTKEKKVTKKATKEMEATIYNAKGASAGKITLSEKAFGLPWNADLVHQVMHSMMSSARQPIAHTKTRGEVRGGGKKPWRQKGTGRARHGSTRSPLWVGGGVAHGPRNDKNYDRKINKTMKAKAFLTVLSRKYHEGQVIFVDTLSFKAPKTSEATAVLHALAKVKGHEKLSTKPKNAAFIALSKKDANAEKSFRNVRSVVVDEVRNLNLLDLLGHTFIIIENPTEAIKSIEAKL
ncbi:MAG: 50S ribosomal protein L4 [Candidatus Taylorbacteria bacterium]|nr:50S ribosomal protein L4 [Candidatus Taylorbacteria bacterium]